MEKKKILQAKEVVKIYGSIPKNQVTALDHVSLDVFEGDFITIMDLQGPVNRPSSTNISTIDLPTSGSVKINGTEVRTMGEIERLAVYAMRIWVLSSRNLTFLGH